MDLTFDEPTHTYRADGVVVPSVTQALDLLGSYDGVPAGAMRVAADRGQAVHLATELYDRGELAWSTVDESIEGYLLAWQTFKTDTSAKVVSIEERVFSRLQYAGTLDRRMVLNIKWPGSKRPSKRRAVVDIKTTAKMMPSVGPQTAAYLEAVCEALPKSERPTERVAVRLMDDGQYQMEILTDRTDLSVFRSTLLLHNWKERHGYND